VEPMTTYLRQAETRLTHAGQGTERARAALREAMGVAAEDTFLRWQEAARQLPLAKEAADKAQPLALKTQASLAGGQNVRVKEVLDALVYGEQSRAAYNETLYRYLLGLAGVERVTAGGVCFPQ
jgi:hypothetical protein